MHIHREYYLRLEKFMAQDYQGNHKKLMLEICYKIICSTPTQNCTIQGHTSNWKGLPKSKVFSESSVVAHWQPNQPGVCQPVYE